MNITFIGLGEVGAILAEDLARHAPRVAWDLQFANASSIPVRNAHALDVRVATSAQDASHDAQLIISAVTASQTIAAAREVAAAIAPGAFYLDLNSAAAATKVEAAALITSAGGRYVEAAVMSPILPKRIGAPMLLGGPHAREAQPMLTEIGFSGAQFYVDVVGAAAAVKLCRSVIVKGMEALLWESMRAARDYGVEQEVLSSLDNLLPSADWPELARYMISRMLEHGARRAEEMHEAARSVSDAGVTPHMSLASAAHQADAAAFRDATQYSDLSSMLDAIGAAAARKSA